MGNTEGASRGALLGVDVPYIERSTEYQSFFVPVAPPPEGPINAQEIVLTLSLRDQEQTTVSLTRVQSELDAMTLTFDRDHLPHLHAGSPEYRLIPIQLSSDPVTPNVPVLRRRVVELGAHRTIDTEAPLCLTDRPDVALRAIMGMLMLRGIMNNTVATTEDLGVKSKGLGQVRAATFDYPASGRFLFLVFAYAPWTTVEEKRETLEHFQEAAKSRLARTTPGTLEHASAEAVVKAGGTALEQLYATECGRRGSPWRRGWRLTLSTVSSVYRELALDPSVGWLTPVGGTAALALYLGQITTPLENSERKTSVRVQKPRATMLKGHRIPGSLLSPWSLNGADGRLIMDLATRPEEHDIVNAALDMATEPTKLSNAFEG
jgi:hypothetical protein